MKNFMQTINTKCGRAGLILKKYSPEIMIGLGLGTMIGGAILACKATIKAQDILQEKKDKLAAVEEIDHLVKAGESDREYTEADKKNDIIAIRAQAAWKLTKCYAPAVVSGLVGVVLILGAYHIQSKRIIALAASYDALRGEYERYRKKVIETIGEEKEAKLKAERFKEEQKEVETRDETNKLHYIPSEYARFFDETNPHWQKHPDYNLIFLKQVQQEMNDNLQLRGHVFLNEVYKALGMEQTSFGSIVGWYLPSKKAAEIGAADGIDTFIDFGIFNPDNEMARRFVNGYEKSILLDFNVQGIIYDLL